MERGAFLLSGMKADRIVIEGGRAAGLEGIALDRLGRPILDERGDRKRIRVKAKKVIVAAGSLASPRLLGRQGIGNPAHRGSHLTLHPSGPAVGMFDQPVRSQDFIPQSIYSHQFLKEGIMLLGAAAEAHMTPPTLPFYGRRLMEIVQRHDYLGPMGFLVTDSTEGRLREGPNGRALLTYNLSKQDTAKVHRAQVLLAELMLEAGAKEVYPGLLRPFTVRNRADLRRLQEAKLGAKDFLVTSYHPLGTCRMSRDAKDGVVDLNHQCHDLPDLFVVDGSTVRGPLGVNPQVTIMALATRAAEKIGPLIED